MDECTCCESLSVEVNSVSLAVWRFSVPNSVFYCFVRISCQRFWRRAIMGRRVGSLLLFALLYICFFLCVLIPIVLCVGYSAWRLGGSVFVG